MNTTNAKYLIVIGLIIVLVGLIFYFAGDKLNWLGNLPGDIKYESENTRVYFPITTMILLSILFSIFMWIVRYFR